MIFRFLNRLNANTGLFNGHYIDVKSFYVLKFNAIPSVTFIGELDVTKTFEYLKERVKIIGVTAYQHSFFDHADNKVYFNNTILVLKNKRMIELADNYCQVLHTPDQYAWAGQLVTDLAQFRVERDLASAFRHTPVVGFAKETAMN